MDEPRLSTGAQEAPPGPGGRPGTAHRRRQADLERPAPFCTTTGLEDPASWLRALRRGHVPGLEEEMKPAPSARSRSPEPRPRPSAAQTGNCHNPRPMPQRQSPVPWRLRARQQPKAPGALACPRAQALLPPGSGHRKRPHPAQSWPLSSSAQGAMEGVCFSVPKPGGSSLPNQAPPLLRPQTLKSPPPK